MHTANMERVIGRERISQRPGGWLPAAPPLSLEQRIAELEVIYDAAPIGIFVCDRDCKFIRVNSLLAEIDGLPAEQHFGKVAWDVIPALRRTLEPVYRRVLDFGETIRKLEVEGETPKAPGITRYWEASYHPISNESDEVVAMCGIVDEITDRKAAEKERVNSEARLQRLLEANLFGIATATLDGITDANDAFLKIVGYSRSEFLQHAIDWRKIAPLEHLDKDLAGLECLKETGIWPAFEKEWHVLNSLRDDEPLAPVGPDNPLIFLTIESLPSPTWFLHTQIQCGPKKTTKVRASRLDRDEVRRIFQKGIPERLLFH